jgi:hypothetical protein
MALLRPVVIRRLEDYLSERHYVRCDTPRR